MYGISGIIFGHRPCYWYGFGRAHRGPTEDWNWLHGAVEHPEISYGVQAHHPFMLNNAAPRLNFWCTVPPSPVLFAPPPAPTPTPQRIPAPVSEFWTKLVRLPNLATQSLLLLRATSTSCAENHTQLSQYAVEITEQNRTLRFAGNSHFSTYLSNVLACRDVRECFRKTELQ